MGSHYKHEKPSVTTWLNEALGPLPRPVCQPMSCDLERRLVKVRFLRTAPLVSALHLHGALGFTALREGAEEVEGRGWGWEDPGLCLLVSMKRTLG